MVKSVYGFMRYLSTGTYRQHQTVNGKMSNKDHVQRVSVGDQFQLLSHQKLGK